MMRYTIIGILLLLSTTLFAQGLFESALVEEQSQSNGVSLDVNGYGRGSAFVGFKNYDYSTLFGEFAVQGKLNKNRAFMYADIRMRDGYRFNESSLQFQLKELYAGYSGEKLDVLLGNQIVSWGRSDGFNPTNCITPSDFFFLTADPDDQKLSNFMLRFNYRLTSQIELNLIGIPVYRPSNYQYELFDLGENVSFAEMILPESTFENSSLAARLNFEFSKVGFSVSWFRGYNPQYSIDIQNIDFSTGVPLITNIARPYFKNMIGADVSAPLGTWIIRGEAAYNITEDYLENMYIPNPDLNYVLGLEHNFGGFTTILQYIGRYTLDFTELEAPVLVDPTNPMAQMQYAIEMIRFESSQFSRKSFNQQEETNHQVALTISKPFAYNTWNLELTGLYNITTEEYLIRPKISWDISDALTASAGCSYMDGPEKELFSYAGPVMNGGFLELKVSF